MDPEDEEIVAELPVRGAYRRGSLALYWVKHIMAKWVIRRAIDGRAISEAKYCAEIRPVLSGTGIQVLEDHIRELLEEDEHAEPGISRRYIMRGDRLVGYIDVTDSHP